MTKLQETRPTTEQDVSDVQLKALGLEQITAWRKSGTPTGKEKNAVRQKRFRQEAAKKGLVPCSLGLVPQAEVEQLKAIAKQLRERNIPLKEAVAAIVQPKIVSVTKKLSADQIRVLRILATGAWRAKLIRFLAGCSL
ncbi:MAG: hypothetical protein KKG88_11070 [Proteobacteria bacterium]|nr:hypothetical protein [Pseudomonadota bacterium]MBU4230825.1 hypothetical protein [Pseudomonadota bacterium]